VAGDIRLPNDIDLTDHVDEEEETNGVLLTDDDSPRRPPTLLRELNLAIIDDETREGMKNLEGEWDTYPVQANRSVVLRPGRDDDHPVGDRRALDSINKAKNRNGIQKSVRNKRVVVERNLSHANTRTATVRTAFLRSSFSVDNVRRQVYPASTGLS
jgi:hypothetical protein